MRIIKFISLVTIYGSSGSAYHHHHHQVFSALPIHVRTDAPTTTTLAHGVRLARLALQRVLLLLVVVVRVLAGALGRVAHVLLHVLEVRVDLVFVHSHQRLHRHGDVRDQRVASGAGKVFADDDCAGAVSRLRIVQRLELIS